MSRGPCGACDRGGDVADMCPPCAQVVTDMATLRKQRPFAVVGESQLVPYGPRVLALATSPYAAQYLIAGDYAPAGYTDLAVVDQRNGDRWAVTA
jgi:hypothetical protein